MAGRHHCIYQLKCGICRRCRGIDKQVDEIRIIVQTEIAGRFEIFCAHSQFSTLTLSVETISVSFFLELQVSENVNVHWHLS